MMKFLQILVLSLFAFNANAKISKWQDSIQNLDAAQVRVLDSFYENEKGEKKLLLGLHFKMKKGWKIYGKESESVGLPPVVKILGLEKYQKHEILWPQAIKIEEKIGDMALNYSVYKKEVILPIEVDLSEIEDGKKFKIDVEYGVCKNICVPASSSFEVVLEDKVDKKALGLIEKFSSNEEVEAVKKSGNMPASVLIPALLAAFVGGLILNIMPCVLPVLGVKLMSILNHQNAQISRIRFSFVSTALGILVSFVAFGLFAISVAAAGEVFNWGVQFQNPYFLIFLVLILLFFVANMLGFFEIKFSHVAANFLNKKIDGAKEKNIFAPNFLSGILAVLLATPCSAPFLGAAISFSITQSPWVIFMIFLIMGIGFALPYIILMIWPKAVYLLPKSGSWMNGVKKIMAIFLLLTILWLIYVISGNLGFSPALTLFILLLLIFACFKIKYKFIQYIAILTLIIAALCVPMKIEGRIKSSKHRADMIWRGFERDKIEQYVAAGKVVVVDVTADWCLTCKFNKYRVLREGSIINRLRRGDIIAMRADITKPNQKVMNFINSHNRFAIPFNVVYGPSAPQGLLASEILTKKEFLGLIDQASKK